MTPSKPLPDTITYQPTVEEIDYDLFRKQGLLREVNEQFFWPKGMALALMGDESGEKMTGVFGIVKADSIKECS